MKLKQDQTAGAAQLESNRSRMLPRKAALITLIALGGCAGPMAERKRGVMIPPAAEAAEAVPAEGAPIVIPISKPEAARAGYTTHTDPFAFDSRLREIAGGISGDNQAKVQAIFSRLRRGASGGVSVMDMSGRAPRTASETLSSGGDCTDLANIVIALFRNLGIPGGAMLVHFDTAPASVDHLVPYAELGGRRVIVDLQVSTLGQTAQGNYREVLRVTLDQAAWMYHREMGDYLRDAGRSTEALAAYRRALEIYDGDAYAHQNAGVLYQRAGDTAAASRHLARAAQLDPAYRTDAVRARYNEELQAGQRAFGEQRWTDCVTHFQAALSSGEAISAQERRTIETNIESCRHNAQVSGQK